MIFKKCNEEPILQVAYYISKLETENLVNCLQV